ncbi:hypothetical protein DdX_06064 [Ditylenchus destructor]|uniref:Uncharacterized protein n=1 Tax=Ditylenchus destructor TaxID=166010 RepID=A0AAD4N6X1_9BILA|nr:hypothetical protein DdX_06064 [Ditylenchus destructor]
MRVKRRRALAEARRARLAAARRARRKLLQIGNKNDLVLTGSYRQVLREHTLASHKRNIQNLVNVVCEVVELKKRRCSSLLQLINSNVDSMVDQMEKILSKIHQIFAQYVPPISITVEDGKARIRNRMEELYSLFKDQFYFTIPEKYGHRYASFSKDTLSIKSGTLNPEEEASFKTLEIQKKNLIREIEEEEIRTIASEQILHERIESLEEEIANVKLTSEELESKLR